jgi:hypothetical protein
MSESKRIIDPNLLGPETRLNAMLEYAKRQPRNEERTYFTSMSDYPLRSVTVTYNNTHSEGAGGDMIWYNEPADGYLIRIPTDFDHLAFEWFETFMTTVGLNHRMTVDKFKVKLSEMIDIINGAIELDHGVMCHRNGIHDSAPLKDKVLLHIVDIIVMFVHKVKPQLGKPIFWLTSAGSNSVDTSVLDNPFIRSLNEAQKRFLYYNTDFFIVVYAYWGNYSFLPCRMIVPEVLVHASDLCKNERFRTHQTGKLEQLAREQRKLNDLSHFMV